MIIWQQDQEIQVDSKKHILDKDGNGKRKKLENDKERKDT